MANIKLYAWPSAEANVTEPICSFIPPEDVGNSDVQTGAGGPRIDCWEVSVPDAAVYNRDGYRLSSITFGGLKLSANDVYTLARIEKLGFAIVRTVPNYGG